MAVIGVVPCSSVEVSMVAARPLAARERMRWASDAAWTAGVATVGSQPLLRGSLAYSRTNRTF